MFRNQEQREKSFASELCVVHDFLILYSFYFFYFTFIDMFYAMHYKRYGPLLCITFEVFNSIWYDIFFLLRKMLQAHSRGAYF